MEWIPTSERLPTREDAGWFMKVLVLRLPDNREKDVMFRSDALPYYLVHNTVHTHWARIPDPPEST